MKKILLIEDNQEVRENTSEILALANYEVVTAENGKKGVELAIQEKPDLIICDIMMPELDGYGVLHILSSKTETASIPFIFLTAKAEKTDFRKGMNSGADDYITKPFDDTELLSAVEIRLRKNNLLKKYEANPNSLDEFIRDAGQLLDVKDLGKDKKIKVFKKKMEIFSEGDLPASMFMVKSGSVKVFKSHAGGKDLIVNLYKANDFFGFESILENTPYTVSAIALEDSELVIIPKHDFLALVNGNPAVSRTFISLLCQKVKEKENQLLNLAYNSVRQRTAEALLKVYKLKEADKKLSLSRDDLARMVGTASESVIRVLSDFKEERAIDIETGKIIIVQPDKLERIVRWNIARD